MDSFKNTGYGLMISLWTRLYHYSQSKVWNFHHSHTHHVRAGPHQKVSLINFLSEIQMKLKVAEDRLSDVGFPVAFSDLVPAKMTWAAGLHIIYVIILPCPVLSKMSSMTWTTTVP